MSPLTNSDLYNNFQLGWPTNASSVWWKYLRFYILHFFHIKKQALFPRSLLQETDSCLINSGDSVTHFVKVSKSQRKLIQSGLPPPKMKVDSLIWGIYFLRVYARLGDISLWKISLLIQLILASTGSLNMFRNTLNLKLSALLVSFLYIFFFHARVKIE